MNDASTARALVPGTELDPAAWHAAFTAAFTDYLIGPFVLTLAQWPGFLARQGVDLAASRAAIVDGELRAFALVAPRPARNRWRLATMGAVPAARGGGAAPMLLDDFIARAAHADMEAVELEVFAANERAVRLYRSRGFEMAHPLNGYERDAKAASLTADEPALPVRPVGIEDALEWLGQAEARTTDLPLQVSAAVVRVAAQAAPANAPLQTWRAGQAQLTFGAPTAATAHTAVNVVSLIDLDPTQQGAAALAHALITAHPGRTIRVPALQRPDLGGDALLRAGFAKQPLHQWLMRRTAI